MRICNCISIHASENDPGYMQDTWHIFTHLVDVVETNDAIKCAVQVVKEIDHLHGATLRAECSEAYDVAKVNCDTLKLLWLYHFAGQQLCGDGSELHENEHVYIRLVTFYNLELTILPRQNLKQQFLCATLFHAQLFGLLIDQTL